MNVTTKADPEELLSQVNEAVCSGIVALRLARAIHDDEIDDEFDRQFDAEEVARLAAREAERQLTGALDALEQAGKALRKEGEKAKGGING